MKGATHRMSRDMEKKRDLVFKVFDKINEMGPLSLRLRTLHGSVTAPPSLAVKVLSAMQCLKETVNVLTTPFHGSPQTALEPVNERSSLTCPSNSIVLLLLPLRTWSPFCTLLASSPVGSDFSTATTRGPIGLGAN